MAEFEWTWDVIDKHFTSLDVFVKHQIDSFNNLIRENIPRTIQQFPIESAFLSDSRSGDSMLSGNIKYTCEFLKAYVTKPLQYKNDSTGYRPLYPNEARLRDLTYSSPLFVDYKQSLTINGKTQVEVTKMCPLADIPIMVGSDFCHLADKSDPERIVMNECPYDRGGYFIVNGNEKVVIAQERPAENQIMFFEESSSSPAPYLCRAEIKSTIDQRFFPVKPVSVKYMKPTKDNKTSHTFEVSLPYIKKPIPLFIVFRALGVITDKQILEMILGDLENPNIQFVNLLNASVNSGSGGAFRINSEVDAIEFISKHLNLQMQSQKQASVEDYEAGANARMKYLKDIINREFLPHVGQDNMKKAFFLARMTRELMKRIINPSLYSDRDHYSNKRVDITGPLLLQIFRFHFNRLIKEIKLHVNKTLMTNQTETTIDMINIARLIQKNNITSKLKHSLSTGNWYTTPQQATSASKKGIAQVLQRLSYLSTLSNLRRIQSPLERAGSKHEPPRRYHATQLGKTCPSETPEGAQVGVVKNMSLLCHVTIDVSSLPVRYLLSKLGITDILNSHPKDVVNSTSVLVNGDFVGIIKATDQLSVAEHTAQIYQMLKRCKLTDKISRYISIAWFTEARELVINTDGGRYCVPFYRLKDGNYLYHNLAPDVKHSANWNRLVGGDRTLDLNDPNSEGVIEYLDTNEEECSMLALFPYQLVSGQIHKQFADGTIQGSVCTKITDFQITSEDPEEFKQNVRKVLNPRWHTLWNQCEVRSVNPETGYVVFGVPQSVSHKVLMTRINRLIYDEYLDYTHCGLHPSMWHGVVAQMIPFPDHNQSPRNCYQSSMGKQAMGIFATNYNVRMDTMASVLCYPQRPLVQTRTLKYTGLEKLPHGYQCIVAIMTYTGYNQEDSVLLNRSAVERGMFSLLFYRTYMNKKDKLGSGGSGREEFGIPPTDNTLNRKAHGADRYHAIDKNTGYPIKGRYVENGDIIISKYRMMTDQKTKESRPVDSSTTVRINEHGVIDWVIPNEQFKNAENAEGRKFVKVRTSTLRFPIQGDKFASRHAQKGTCGMLYNDSDMPHTQTGVIPDLIMNPHAIPSRMTIGQLIEAVLGKVAVLQGTVMDATPFTEFSLHETKHMLSRYGFDYNGNEIMYNGQTGEQFEVATFINPTYYQRLKHMISDKVHARDMGPIALMTRQPAEGRARDGGLRIGEMERDCLIAHGATNYLKRKLTEESDIFKVYLDRMTGHVISANPDLGIYSRGTEDINDRPVDQLNIPFASKLLIDELATAMIDVKLITE